MEHEPGRLARTALALRHRLIRPGGRAEAVYRRLLRPLGRRLLPRLPRAVPGPAVARRAPFLAANAAIAVLKPDHLGDFLIALPALARLRAAMPQARITLICAPWTRILAERAGLFDAIETVRLFAQRAEDAPPVPDLAAIAALGPFDAAIDLRVDGDSRCVLRALPARWRLGYAAAGQAGFDALPRPVAQPGHDTALHQRALLGSLVAAVLAAAPDDTLGRLAEPPAPALCSFWQRPAIALSTGSGRAIKNWPVARFAALAAVLLERGLAGHVVLLGGAELHADAQALVKALPEGCATDLTGALSMPQSLGALAECDGFVGNDTALGHAAAALGLATCVAFSGIDPLPVWRPVGPRAVAVVAPIACSPCHLSDLALCPNGHGCMTGITVEDMLAGLARAQAEG